VVPTDTRFDPERLPRPLARVQEALRTTGDDPRSRHAAAFASLEALTRWQGILLVVLVARVVRILGARRPVAQRIDLEAGETLEVRHLAGGGVDR